MKKNFLSLVLLFIVLVVCPLVVHAQSNFWVDLSNYQIELTTTDDFIIPIKGETDGELKWVSFDESVLTVENGVVTPVSDGAGMVIVSDDVREFKLQFLVTAFGEEQGKLDSYVNNYIPDNVTIDIPRKLDLIDIEDGMYTIDDILFGYVYKNFQIPNDYDASFSIDCNEDKSNCEISASKVFMIEHGDTNYYVGMVASNVRKKVTINYVDVTEEERQEVKNALSNTKDVYKVYINDIIQDKVNYVDDLLLNKSTIRKDMGPGIDLLFDSRAGSFEPGNAAALGFVLAGKNGVYSAVKEIHFYQVLSVPILKGDKEEALKDFIEKNLLNENQEVEVKMTDEKEFDQPIYEITISTKKEQNLLSMLFSPFFLNVYADDSYTIATTIEEDPNYMSITNTTNPDTSDHIGVYVVTFVAATLGLGLVTYKFKKRMN